MTPDLNAIISQIGRDKGIDKEKLIEAVETAMLSAAKKHYGHNLNLEAVYNEETGQVDVHQFKTVVDNVVDRDTEISLEEAKEYDSEAMVGDEIGIKLDTEVLGRIAAQTAKQVIIQKVRDAERGVIYEEYKNSKGDIISGIVQRYDRGDIIVNLGRTEAILPRREQISKERYRQGDRVRGMILDIDRTARGPQIILTRSHPDFLKKLFEIEVPEIADGTIEIKGVAREPGERAKIAVYSSETNLDPVGACVGIRGSRVQAVVQELRGERIDIITWTPDAPSFVARALSPAEVSRVMMDEDNRSMEVIVDDDQLSLAIGRKGQNVKLASKLTGWRIDVRSSSVAEAEAKKARAALEAIPGIQFTHAELLFQEGFRSLEDVAEASVEDLTEVEGINNEMAEEIIRSAKEALAKGELLKEEQEVVAQKDLERLLLPPYIIEALVNAGYKTVQDIVLADDSDLLAISEINEKELGLIKESIDVFFKEGKNKAKKV